MKIDFRKDKRTYPRGLVAISWGDEYNRRTKETLKDVRFVIHLFPSYDSDDDQERHWLGFQWGWVNDYENFWSFGGGPLFLFCRS